jgi:hypothetical protein
MADVMAYTLRIEIRDQWLRAKFARNNGSASSCRAVRIAAISDAQPVRNVGAAGAGTAGNDVCISQTERPVIGTTKETR